MALMYQVGQLPEGRWIVGVIYRYTFTILEPLIDLHYMFISHASPHVHRCPPVLKEPIFNKNDIRKHWSEVQDRTEERPFLSCVFTILKPLARWYPNPGNARLHNLRSREGNSKTLDSTAGLQRDLHVQCSNVVWHDETHFSDCNETCYNSKDPLVSLYKSIKLEKSFLKGRKISTDVLGACFRMQLILTGKHLVFSNIFDSLWLFIYEILDQYLRRKLS
jgi:hypothetical protein